MRSCELRGAADDLPMSMKLIAVLSLGAVLAVGGFLVSKAKSPTASVGVGIGVVQDDSNVATISSGGEVELGAHIDPDGGYTLFEFTADW
jgi:hypothetical protein